MKSGKKIVIVMIMILLILLLAIGGVFAYFYMATDVLKTDKQLFLEYFSQITAEDGFWDKKITEFNEKKTQNSYEDSGKITFEVVYPDSTMESIIKKVNDLSINYSGKVDSVNQKVEQNIEVDYGNNVKLPINYRQDGKKFGLQTDELSKKFIAIRNENLDELIDDMSGEDITSMSSRIDGIVEILTANTDLISEMELSEDEKNQLQQIYSPILQESLVEEKFTSTKTEQNESYTLEISFQEIKDMIIKMLEKTKENTLIMDKLNEAALKIDPDMKPMNTSDIDEIIKSLNEDDVSQMSNLKITLVQSNKKLNQMIIENQEGKILIEKNKTADVLVYNITFEQLESGKQEEAESSIIIENTQSSEQINMYFNVQYSGLEALNNVQENYKVGFSVTSEGEKMRYDYKIDSNTQFVDSISIDVIDESTAVILNDYEEEQITSFLGQVGTKLLDINKKQMEELGLKEYENPVLYTNPITMLAISIFNMANDTIGSTDFGEQEKLMFNSQFTKYEGAAVKGSTVNAMLTTVYNNNSVSPQGESLKRLVKVTLDGAEISVGINTTVDVTKLYTVALTLDEDGFVAEVKVTTNN